jgi:hypothetical protein
MNYENVEDALTQLSTAAEQIAGQWNGDNPGRGEERAGVALEIIEKVKELRELMEYLEEN